MNPAAWLSPEGLLIPHDRFMALPKYAQEGTPLYPRKEWQWLTDEEIDEAHETTISFHGFARAIQTKSKEKNT